MCCGRGWKAGSRTRPPAASCAAACRPGWSGARPAVRSACTPTRPSPASSPRCSSSSRSAGRCGPPGCGCASRAYAGAYVYGRTRDERYLGKDGVLRKRRRKLPRDQWEVLITGHHQGFTDWDTYLANQERIGTNIRPQARKPGTGAVREGCALLQGLATGGTCGRELAVFYRGPAKSVPNYYCQGPGDLVDGRGTRHMNAGGQAIDSAVAGAFLAALAPAALPPAPKASPGRNGPRSWPSATTSTRSGTHRPPPTRTASSCCGPCSRKSTSRSAVTPLTRTPAWCCGGKAARSAS